VLRPGDAGQVEMEGVRVRFSGVDVEQPMGRHGDRAVLVIDGFL